MARSLKIWLHAKSGFWCVQLNRKRLDRDPKVAERKLRTILADLKRESSGDRHWLDAAYCDLADEFLDHVKATKKEATYDNYRYSLRRAIKVLGGSVRVGELRRFHLAKSRNFLPTTLVQRRSTARSRPSSNRSTGQSSRKSSTSIR